MQLLILLFAVIAIASAIGLVSSRSPVNSALWLVLNLFCVAALYITLNAQFIGIIQVLVYAGAIMVLFLFVIMLLNLGALPQLESFGAKRVLAFLVGMGVLAQLVYIVAGAFGVLPQPATLAEAGETASASNLARELFTTYALPLEVIGVLLLAATIGAVLLAKRKLV